MATAEAKESRSRQELSVANMAGIVECAATRPAERKP